MCLINIEIRPFGSFSREIEEAEVSVRERGVLFDITASTILPALEAPEEFTCELHIPQANYTVRKETVFYPGKYVFVHLILLFFSFLRFLLLSTFN